MRQTLTLSRRCRRPLAVLALIPALIPALAAPAFAHVSLAEPSAPAGSSYRATLRVPHGCDGAATTAIRVEIPEGFQGAKPMPKPGWTLALERGTLAHPYQAHGKTVTEDVTAVTWSGGELPDDFYDEFVFQGTVGAEAAPGTVLHFLTHQTCGAASADWTGTGEGGAEPAPALTVTAGKAGGHDHGDMQMGAMPGMQMGGTQMDDMKMEGMAMPATTTATASDPATLGAATLGALQASGAFARATPPHAPVAGGYVTLFNAGKTVDRLVSASADFAGRTQIHEMTMQGDRMIMRPLTEGIAIAPGETITLAPGGTHLMFLDLEAGLNEGETHQLTLSFEKAGTLTLALPVLARDAEAPASPAAAPTAATAAPAADPHAAHSH